MAKQKISDGGAVVSRNLQLAVVSSALLVWTVQVGMGMYFSINAQLHNYGNGGWWYTFGWLAGPVLLFVAALWYEAGNGRVLNRIFQATLLSIAAAFIGMVFSQLITAWLSSLFIRQPMLGYGTLLLNAIPVVPYVLATVWLVVRNLKGKRRR